LGSASGVAGVLDLHRRVGDIVDPPINGDAVCRHKGPLLSTTKPGMDRTRWGPRFLRPGAPRGLRHFGSNLVDERRQLNAAPRHLRRTPREEFPREGFIRDRSRRTHAL
jgi:hypothetical protein